MHVSLQNHSGESAIRDALALFAAQLESSETGLELRLIQGAEGPDPELVQSFSRPLSKAEQRGLLPDAPPLTVSTRLAGQSMAATVLPVHARREAKRQIYLLLSEYTGLAWPWGALTGIRPTQVAAEVLAETGDEEKAAALLVSRYALHAAKARLAVRTARAEQALLRELPAEQPLVYAGVPFCPSRCSYCSFISRDAIRQADQLHPYVDAMIAETRQTFAGFQRPVSALYLGGGTPSSLDEADFARLLQTLVRTIPLAEQAEITVEAGRPDTITAGKLAVMRSLGIGRICINPQSMHDATLQRAGRRHSVAAVRQAFALARQAGMDNINMDLILGLPGEEAEDFLDSVEQLIAMEPEDITLHTLAMKRSARLAGEKIPVLTPRDLPDPQLEAVLEEAQALLLAHGYAPYYLYRQKHVRGGLENTGFAKAGKGCRYNVGMMSDRLSVIGLGSGSSSKRVNGRLVERLHNSKDLEDYCRRIAEISAKKAAFFAALRESGANG